MPHLEATGPPWPEVPVVREDYLLSFTQGGTGEHGPVLYWRVCYDTQLFHSQNECVSLSFNNASIVDGVVHGRVSLLREGSENGGIWIQGVALKSQDPRCRDLSSFRSLSTEEISACSETLVSEVSNTIQLPQAKAHIVPEPGVLLSLLAGLLGLWMVMKSQRKNR